MNSLNITIEPLGLKHLHEESGFFQTLSNLSPAPVMDMIRAQQILNRSIALGKSIWVAIDQSSGQIVGTVSFIVEYKFTREGITVGHIEDMVTRDGYEGNGIASALIKEAMRTARQWKCFKLILDCSKENEAFYERFGFRKHETMMRLDLE